MTRGDIILLCRDTLGEDISTEAGGNPGAWNRLVTTAADEVARASWCLYGSYGAPLTAQQAQYCAPGLIELQAASVYYADGSRHNLSMSTFAAMDNCGSGWRDEVAGNPRILVAAGLNQFVLHPAPSYSSVVQSYTDLVIQSTTSDVASSARPFVASDVGLQLVVSGGTGYTTNAYFVISVSSGIATLSNAPAGDPVSVGVAASTGGTATLTSGGLVLEGWGVTVTTPGQPGDWSASNALCPLPDRAHMAVVWKACLLRIMQKPTKENLLRQESIAVEFRSEMNRLQSEVRRWTQATREPAYTDGGGAFWSTSSNPLDLW